MNLHCYWCSETVVKTLPPVSVSTPVHLAMELTSARKKKETNKKQNSDTVGRQHWPDLTCKLYTECDGTSSKLGAERRRQSLMRCPVFSLVALIATVGKELDGWESQDIAQKAQDSTLRSTLELFINQTMFQNRSYKGLSQDLGTKEYLYQTGLSAVHPFKWGHQMKHCPWLQRLQNSKKE